MQEDDITLADGAGRPGCCRAAGGRGRGCASGNSNDTNQPQVLHTSTCECTDKTCLMPQVVASTSPADSLQGTEAAQPCGSVAAAAAAAAAGGAVGDGANLLAGRGLFDRCLLQMGEEGGERRGGGVEGHTATRGLGTSPVTVDVRDTIMERRVHFQVDRLKVAPPFVQCFTCKNKHTAKCRPSCRCRQIPRQ